MSYIDISYRYKYIYQHITFTGCVMVMNVKNGNVMLNSSSERNCFVQLALMVKL